MAGPTTYAAYTPSGSTTATLTSKSFAGFTAGQTLYMSFYYNSTRTTGSATDTITVGIQWYNNAGTLLSTTNNVTNVSGTTTWYNFVEYAVVAPVNATSGVCVFTVAPGLTTTQHNIYIAKIRLGRTQVGATQGATWGTNVSNIPANLAALVGTENINNQTLLNSIANDDVLSVNEKITDLSKLYADLEARYQDLFDRATTLAISTTALTNARTAWKNYLTALSPAWNDLTQDTTLFISEFADTQYPTGWTLTSVTAPANGIYNDITDATASVAGNINRSVSGLSGVNTHAACIVVKKDAVTTRFARLELAATAGTAKTGGVNLNTSTGTTGDGANLSAFGVLDLGDEWLLYAQITTNSTNTGLTVRFYPAFTATITATTATVATTGTVTTRSPLLTGPGKTTNNLGRDFFTGLLNAYASEMAGLAAAISQKDGTTGLVIPPIPPTVLSADVNGTINTGQLPKDISFVANIGTADVTALGTWSASFPGNITGTIGSATGIVNITAMTGSSATIIVTFIYSGVTRTYYHGISVVNDPPTSSGGGGGGGGSGGSVSTATLAATNTTATYGTATSGILSIAAGPLGQVALNAPIAFQTSPAPGTGVGKGAAGKWQWRTVGGSFADVGTEVTAQVNATKQGGNGDPIYYEDGSLTVAQTKTGLTNGTTYEFQFTWRCTTSGSSAYRQSGTMTATAS